EEDQASSGRSSSADRAQDRGCALVVPVVEDRRQQVDVALGDAVEEAAFDELDPLVAQGGVVANGLREIEDDAAEPRLPAQQLHEQGAVSASHVDDAPAV